MELNWQKIMIGLFILCAGIIMLFFDQTQNIAPFLIGFSIAYISTP